MTVGNLRSEAAAATGAPKRHVRLTSIGKQLHGDDSTLRDHGVGHEDAVSVTLTRGRGGGGDSSEGDDPGPHRDGAGAELEEHCQSAKPPQSDIDDDDAEGPGSPEEDGCLHGAPGLHRGAAGAAFDDDQEHGQRPALPLSDIDYNDAEGPVFVTAGDDATSDRTNVPTVTGPSAEDRSWFDEEIGGGGWIGTASPPTPHDIATDDWLGILLVNVASFRLNATDASGAARPGNRLNDLTRAVMTGCCNLAIGVEGHLSAADARRSNQFVRELSMCQGHPLAHSVSNAGDGVVAGECKESDDTEATIREIDDNLDGDIASQRPSTRCGALRRR